MNLFYQPLIQDGVNNLDSDESRHCVKVLRKKKGDTIRITDGKGFFYDAIIADAAPGKCVFTIASKTAVPVRPFSIHIALSPLKNPDRLEWFVEKVVEIGVEKISFIDCEHSERTFIKADRLQKIAVSAMKQSLKAWLPPITSPVRLNDFINNTHAGEKYIAFVDATNPDHLMRVASPGSGYLVLIGPEGDFSAGELQLCLEAGYRKISLGESRLRTETAGIVACNILNLVNA